MHSNPFYVTDILKNSLLLHQLGKALTTRCKFFCSLNSGRYNQYAGKPIKYFKQQHAVMFLHAQKNRGLIIINLHLTNKICISAEVDLPA